MTSPSRLGDLAMSRCVQATSGLIAPAPCFDVSLLSPRAVLRKGGSLLQHLARVGKWQSQHCHTPVNYFNNNGITEDTEAVRASSALAQPNRLRVFRALVVAGRDGLTPGVLADQFNVAPATLSSHLKELMYAGLMSQTRDGRNLIYRASFDHMNALLAFLTSNCCEGQPCELDTSTISCNC
jgi:DNA-binding transcriptional ArsR family regulator